MVAAMMLPLKIDCVRRIAERSLWSRRTRSIAAFLAGYVFVWALAGLPLAWANAAFHVPERLGWKLGAAIGLFLAAAWLLSPWKAVAERMCHRTLPLSPRGWKADCDCAGYGWISGYACALNCWPLMFGWWLSGHSLAMMSVGFGFGWVDRHFAPSHRKYALILGALASAFALASAT
jgi:hypothetical protein